MSVRASPRPARVRAGARRQSSTATSSRRRRGRDCRSGPRNRARLLGLAGELAPGTKIDGVAVGGLTAHEAEALLARAEREHGPRFPVTFTVAGTPLLDPPGRAEHRRPLGTRRSRRRRPRADGMDVIRGFRRLALRFFPVDMKPKVSAYDAAVTYELGLIAAKVDQATHPARLVRTGLTLTVVPGQAGAPRSTEAAAKALILTSLASLSRTGPVELPTASCSRRPRPARPGNGAGSGPSRRLAGPVKVVVGKRHFRVSRSSSRRCSSCRRPRAASSCSAARRPTPTSRSSTRLVGQPAHGARFSAYGDHVSVIPAAAGRRARRARAPRPPCSPRPSRRTQPRRAPRGHPGHGRPQHDRGRQAMGITGRRRRATRRSTAASRTASTTSSSSRT